MARMSFSVQVPSKQGAANRSSMLKQLQINSAGVRPFCSLTDTFAPRSIKKRTFSVAP